MTVQTLLKCIVRVVDVIYKKDFDKSFSQPEYARLKIFVYCNDEQWDIFLFQLNLSPANIGLVKAWLGVIFENYRCIVLKWRHFKAAVECL